ncbi:glycosyltransferase family 4 protein [Chitinophaga sedimenti]|uniref:glycosyltransferase family 4 protein n=1 Tax=Chitinophaga sedimenti TaxID=2033606 RepID=UPI0020032FFB|nr:glycosyltransferase family 4 protein [Chitinophaga sedimenti]MCK7558105.1 glycosyltransferase family 4 protein [Chitinophaga sedimenti]
MKVLLVSNTSWSFYKFRKGLLGELVKKGHEVVVVANSDQFVKELKDIGVKFIALQYMQGRGVGPVNELKLIRELITLYRSERPDIIFQYTIKPNIYGSLAARVVKIPVIAVITGLGFTFINKGIVPSVARMLYKVALRKVKSVWFLNDDDREIFVSKKLVKAKQAFVLPGEGINCDYFAPIEQVNPEQFGVRFVLPARMLYDKGIKEYVEAARIVLKEYPAVQFALLGAANIDNPTAIPFAQIEEWEKEGVIKYLGSVDDVRKILQEYSCVVLPSYREGMSMVLMESASMALPLIVSDIPGCRELVDDKHSGLLCQARNSEDLAVKMMWMIGLSDKERKQMGENGRQKMLAQYSERVVFERYFELLHDFKEHSTGMQL